MSVGRSSPHRALLVTPTIPALSGNGLAMRAGMLLDALAEHSRVTLLVIPVAGSVAASWSEFVLARTEARHSVTLDRSAEQSADSGVHGPIEAVRAPDVLRDFLNPALARLLSPTVLAHTRELVGELEFDLVVIMRLYLAPLLASFDLDSPRKPRLWLDADDDEVSTRRQIADVYSARGRTDEAAGLRGEAERYLVLESQWVHRFDVISVCSHTDRSIVSARTGHRGVHVVPNTAPFVSSSDAGALHARPTDERRLLFVGSLSYFPNVDAVLVLCHDVLPALRELTRDLIRVEIVGARPDKEVLALRDSPGVAVHADVDALGPFYARADVAVVPLRAGGGTRIKILEALAYGTPVVSTAAGARGLDVVHGEHILIADEPATLAAACLRVCNEPDLASTLRANGRALAAASYSRAGVLERIRMLMPATPADGLARR